LYVITGFVHLSSWIARLAFPGYKNIVLVAHTSYFNRLGAMYSSVRLPSTSLAFQPVLCSKTKEFIYFITKL
jgi:hypothetical protein